MSEEVAIKVENVSKDFILPQEKVNSVKGLLTGATKGRSRRKIKETQHALRDVSFAIKQGEFFGIVGRNGSGKSTMLKILAGIYQPTEGKVYTRGKLVPFIELGVGFNPELTGRENVYLNGAMLGFSEKEVDDMYGSIVKFAELERFMDQKLKNYSSGMQVRLAFSLAIRAEADILLIDEVLAVGDADFQRKCYDYFKSLKKNKKTVVFVSHDMSAIREYCDSAIMIEDSRIVFSGSASDTAKEYTKLFMPEIYAANKREAQRKSAYKGNSKKWGTGGVDIINLSVSKQVFTDKDKTIKIIHKIKASKGFEGEIIPGVTIKDESGMALCGTNTKILHPDKRYNIGGDNGSVIDVKWEIPNVFNSGTYFIEPAILSASNNDTLQWWDEAESFEVTNDKSTPYVVAPDISVEL
jgi:ABC-2 type transport system ATP-binding protein